MAICSHAHPSANLLHWFRVHMRGSRSLYGKLCDLRSIRPPPPQRVNSHYPPAFSPRPTFHPLILNKALYISLVIFKFHCLSEAVISWLQTNLYLLYISCESPGESCLYMPETRTFRKTARRTWRLVLMFSLFFPPFEVSSWILWDTCTVRVWGWGVAA